MTTWFVSRHPAAVEWVRRRGVAFDQLSPHLDLSRVRQSDRVIGSLPINLAAEVCAVGAEYWHLSLRVQPEQRGRELSAEEFEAGGASLERYLIRKTGSEIS